MPKYERPKSYKASERRKNYGIRIPEKEEQEIITRLKIIATDRAWRHCKKVNEIAVKIAKALHAKKGGFATVKAMAASIPEQNATQIGMSISDFEKTPLYRVFEVIKIEADRYNVPIVGAEFCGMAPLKALIDVANYYLKIDNLTEDRVLEIAVQKAFEKGKGE